MAAIIEVVDLVKHFPGVKAVDGLSFAIPAGSCFGLLSPNGAGKTTTIELLEGILTPDSGQSLFHGAPRGPDYRSRIGIQFQHTALQDFLTVRDTLRLFASLYPNPLPRELLIDLCALGEFIDRDSRKLSGGQRQRLLLALALLGDPELLFLDEPTTGLDPQVRHHFWQRIEAIKAQGKTVVLTTHYMDEAQQLCDLIAIVDHGHLLSLDTPAALLAQHFDGVLVRLGGHPALAGLGYPLRPVGDQVELCCPDVATLLPALLDLGVPLTGMQVRSPNLEDLFLNLTGHSLRSGA
ncbi:ABC transporter ATP-binding protein [Aeromonas caviae]|uniref:ABC transporter ATP-binding protein n=1 Tax=Aeromonas caviae TaxID=648 RepID=UPI003F744820